MNRKREREKKRERNGDWMDHLEIELEFEGDQTGLREVRSQGTLNEASGI